MKQQILRLALSVAVPALLSAQSDVIIRIMGGSPPVIAVPDMRGTGEAQKLMDAFNRTLFADLQDSGFFKMAPKSMYPLTVPQQPQDLRTAPDPQRKGLALADWAGAPVDAKYLTLGYTAIQNDRLALFGWLFDTSQATIQGAQALNKLYFGSVDEAGAIKVAHDFAADILLKFGGTPLFQSKIYFTSSRSGSKEIWSMNWDGSDQKQLTKLGSVTRSPAVSPDGTRLAFMTFARGNPTIMMMSLETGRVLPFYSPKASVNQSPDFSSDGRLFFSSSAGGGSVNVYRCNIDGSGLERVASTYAIEVEPKVNPKTGADLVMTSGRSGPPQIYRMSAQGTDAVRLTNGEGQAVNPAWHPDGQHIVFSWTRGFEPGNFNIFVMDVATREIVQLTHGRGRNEYPSWAPDGRHIVFASTRSGRSQIYSMLADGTNVRQLTSQGVNENPVWAK